MSATPSLSSETMVQERDRFVERLLESVSGVFTIFSLYLGNRLSFWQALAEGGPLTAAELASRTGTHQRYTREWLEQQTVTGIIEVEDALADAIRSNGWTLIYQTDASFLDMCPICKTLLRSIPLDHHGGDCCPS